MQHFNTTKESEARAFVGKLNVLRAMDGVVWTPRLHRELHGRVIPGPVSLQVDIRHAVPLETRGGGVGSFDGE